MKKQSNIAEQQVIFTFDGLEPVILHLDKVSDEVLERAQYHGFEARIGDNAAISRKGPDGAVITVTEAMRREAVMDLITHYESGTKEWGMRTAKAPVQNPIWAAIAAKKGMTYEAYAAERVAADLAELEGL